MDNSGVSIAVGSLGGFGNSNSNRERHWHIQNNSKSVLTINAPTEASAAPHQPDAAASAADRGAVCPEEPQTRVFINNAERLAKTPCFTWTDLGP